MMGIPYLTKHLLPYADTVFLDGKHEVVIDGPSLVYHVHRRLLGWMDPNCDILDYQPSCDEISRGVGSFLHRICFDGALPLAKRKTRVSRMEKSRHRLTLARRNLSLPAASGCRDVLATEPGQVWCSRGLPRGRRGLPENPFMVSAVCEDLQYRWSKDVIQKEIHHDINCLEGIEYPWAAITMMVPGEADVECARVSRLTGCAVLTDDSDLLLHDLGSSGSVLFLDSVQSPTRVWDPVEPQIQGLRICPSDLSVRLGITNIQRFGFELTRDPHLRFAEAIRKSKVEGTELSSEYYEFLREYHHPTDRQSAGRAEQPQLMDPRVSELYWQYALPDTYCSDESLHVYLGVLNEDPGRRCAWDQGQRYRRLGYAAFNASRGSQFTAIYEFVRRGGRIVADKVTLDDTIMASDMQLLRRRLVRAQEVFNPDAESFWFSFALAEIYETSNTVPSGQQLESFLTHGYMEGSTGWADIHLLAQVQAVLYSLRMLQQLRDVAAPRGCDLPPLAKLPPLHVMMSRQKLIQSFGKRWLLEDVVSQLLTGYDT
ncbi:unnamed protein product [Penicillium olsonii]|uniref:Asteroid domain-containing protein n=1 Tax=Penicillium olsonii TaxID=99116 RepID=A0A9W4MWR7_PENOL|nr:unnamed protein product [Penicillium olsonii]CAG8194651.1 unnamed protein product [Penicillium olsonii]